ncbi:MAG TPA: hypothetical protein VFN07_08805, partial [Trueperaceae bacterium]|nr:hypothetical protein [Trueperaceae bacterium]
MGPHGDEVGLPLVGLLMIVQALAPKAVNVLFREPGMTTERLAQLGVRRASVGSGQGHLAGVRRGHLTTCVT